MIRYLITLTVFAVVMIVCIVRSHQSDKSISKPIEKLLYTGLLPILANLAIAVSGDRQISNICVIIYFISTDWMIYFLIAFVMEYCGYRYERTGFNMVMLAWALLDSVMILLNPLYGHVYYLKKIDVDGSTYYRYMSEPAHYIHLGMSFLLMILAIGLLIYKLVTTSKLYIEKYLVVELSLVVVVFWEAYYIFLSISLDYSMIGYSVAGALVYYFAIEYTPLFAMDSMLSDVVMNISDAILLFDENNNCIYINQGAQKFFTTPIIGRDNKEVWQKVTDVLTDDYTNMEDIYRDPEYHCVRDFEVDGVRRTYEIEFQRLQDKRGNFAGSFISAKDRTLELQRLENERRRDKYDKLTGVYNVDYFYEMIRQRLREEPSQKYVIIASDIRQFKLINDIYGFSTGDSIIIHIANELMENATADMIYGRITNDKFGVMMKKEDFKAENFLAYTENLLGDYEDMSYPIIVQMGVYEIKDPKLAVTIMFDRAFMAIDTIKTSIGERIAYYEPGMRDKVVSEVKAWR